MSHASRERVTASVSMGSEFADKAYFGLEVLAELVGDPSLDFRDQLPDVSGGGFAKVDDDVGVEVRHLRIANAMSLHATLIDETPRADTFDLLEDGPRAGMNLEPGVPRAAPGKVLLQDAIHAIPVARRQVERDGQCHVMAVVQDARVVAEGHLVTMDDTPSPFLREQFARVEHLGDEHGSLAFGRRRQEMEVLPYGAPHGARYADVVLQTGEAAMDRGQDEILHNRATFGPQPGAVVTELARHIPDHGATKPLVTNQYVRAESEDKMRQFGLAARLHGVCEIVGRRSIVQQICRTTDPESGVRSQRDISP